MQIKNRLKIAIQKNGRLNNDSIDLLLRCGLKIRISEKTLLHSVENLPVDLLFVRDDDIPTLVSEKVCDLGIIGENVLNEQLLEQKQKKELRVLKKLGFCRCRLSIAIPKEYEYDDVKSLQHLRIATSFPNLLTQFLQANAITAEIVPIAGSVEIAPKLNIADAICDLVSTGRTLSENHLIEVQEILQSEAVLITAKDELVQEKLATYELLMRRIDSVLKALESKYIMFHAPIAALPTIQTILPGRELPTIVPLQGSTDKVAVHVVSAEAVFWSTLERLKQAGASSILVLPIEKMLS